MHLSCQKALLAAALLTMACRESTGPTQIVAGEYVLETINGSPVPAVVFAGQADTSFMIAAALTLDTDGNAVRFEHWRYMYPPNRVDEGTATFHQEYRLSGDEITVGRFTPCPPNALCEGNKVGKFTSTTLTLAYENNPTSPRYFYRLAR